MKSIYIFLFLCLSFPSISQVLTSYYEDDGLISNSVNCVSVGEGTNVYFGTQFGVSHFDGSIWINYDENDGLVDNNVTAILYVDGVIWAGTDFGFSTYDGTDWTTYTTDDGLEDNRIKDFYQDSDGLIWIGNNDGVSTFDGTTFTNFTTTDGLPFGGVSDVTQDEEGNMWCSNGIFGVIMYDGSSFTTFDDNDGLLSNSVRATTVSSANRKWIGTAAGVSVLDANNAHEGDHEIIFILPPPDELNPVEDIAIDSQGHIWAAVYVDYLVTVGGISLYDSGSWYDYDEEDGLAGPNVRAIDIDAEDGVWVATSTGVTYISDVPFSTEEIEPSALQAYPNPTSDVVYLQLDNSATDIKIYSATAQLVHAEHVAGVNSIHEIDLSQFSEGVYLLKYGNYTHRLVLNR